MATKQKLDNSPICQQGKLYFGRTTRCLWGELPAEVRHQPVENTVPVN